MTVDDNTPAAIGQNFAVWNRSQLMPAYMILGVTLGASFPCGTLLHDMWTQKPVDGFFYVASGLFGLFPLLGIFVLTSAYRNRRHPLLLVTTHGLQIRGRRPTLGWRDISRFSLQQRVDRYKKPMRGEYDLHIYYRTASNSHFSSGDEENHQVLLSSPSVRAELLLHVLENRVQQAYSHSTASASDGSVACADHDPRISPVSTWQNSLNTLALLWLTLAVALGGVGGYDALLTGGLLDAFQPSANAAQLGYIGAATGLLLFLALLPQWEIGSVGSDDYTRPIPFSSWNLLYLPVFIGLFGYVPGAYTLPRILNTLEGQTYQTHLILTGKEYEPRAPRHSECYRVDVREQHGDSSGSFCVDSSEYATLQGGDSFTATGQRSRWGRQLSSHSFSPEVQVTASPASIPEPDHQKPGTPAIEPASLQQQRDEHEKWQDVCMDLKHQNDQQQTLLSHANMAQACSKAGIRYD